MNPAIHFNPEAYSTAGPRLMGRNAAGESFLRGFLAHSQNTEFWIHVEQHSHIAPFKELVRAAGRTEAVKAADNANLARFADPGLIHYPGPAIGTYAWHRAAFGHDKWSLCGITHTTASAHMMDAITNLLTQPLQPWDAVICTSHAVKDNVSRLLQAQTDYLHARLGITRVTLPMLPVIPLGIHTQDFVFSDMDRMAARRKLDIGPDVMVVLYMGRLSFHAKAHPLAMYQALEKAAGISGKQVVLIECGWHANEMIAASYAQGARTACPGIRTISLDGRDGAARNSAWAAADVFCSLSDNIQESFGITPVEAMASGLPVIVSDWDGYKDTVRDGIDGFRIPTIMPEPGYGFDLAIRHALDIETYDRYCGNVCMVTAVDMDAASQAFARLFASPELRSRFGAAGRERARRDYDWSGIIPRYEALWREQTERRLKDGAAIPPLAHPWPARIDPFFSFTSYPTRQLNADTRLALTDETLALAESRLRQLSALSMVDFATAVIPPHDQSMSILTALAKGEQSAGDLALLFPAARRNRLVRSLGYLAKLGIIRIAG